VKINLQVYFSQTPLYCCRNYYKTTCKAGVFKRINSFLHSRQASLSMGCLSHFLIHLRQKVCMHGNTLVSSFVVTS